MRVFCGTLLADLAVPDVLAKLRGAGGLATGLDADTLTVRLEQLVKWGNLLRSSHTVRASSISEYQRSRARYQLSKLVASGSSGTPMGSWPRRTRPAR